MIILAFHVLFRIIIIGQVVFELYYIWSLVFLMITASPVFLGVQLSVSGLSLCLVSYFPFDFVSLFASPWFYYRCLMSH